MRRILYWLALAAFCFRASAQNAPSAVPVIHSESNLVLVDVVALDHGHSVQGLAKARFHVYEDGREQTIAGFDLHTAPAVATPAVTAPTQTDSYVYSNTPVAGEPVAYTVLLLDGLNTKTAAQQNVRRHMLEFLRTVPPGTPLALFTLSTHLRLVQGFTTDIARMADAVLRLDVQAAAALQNDPESDQQRRREREEMRAEGVSEEILKWMAQGDADDAAIQTDARTGMTIDAMEVLARYLSGIPGRKNLIWVSSAFPITMDSGNLESLAKVTQNNAPRVRAMSRLLADARVAVYPIDPRGLESLPITDASRRTMNSAGMRPTRLNNPDTTKTDIAFVRTLASEQQTMLQIAEVTGGRAFFNTNGLKEAIASAVDDGSTYYTLSYVPSGHSADGKFHAIRVKVDNGPHDLSYRRGYFAAPTEPDTSTAPMLRAALQFGAPAQSQIKFRAELLAPSDPRLNGMKQPAGPAGDAANQLKPPVHRVVVDLVIDTASLLLQQDASGLRRSSVQFALIAYDVEGRRLNALERIFDLQLDSARYARVLESGLPIRFPFDLPAQPVALRIAVLNLTAGRSGSLEIPWQPKTGQ